MATQDTSKEDEVLETKDDVETSTEEDEITEGEETEATEETEDSDDEESEDEDEQSETEDEEEPEFKKRFTQFKGDSFEEYTPKLEEAYGNLLREMTRIKQEDKGKQAKLDSVMAAAAKDPEFAKKLDELMGGEAESVTVDPALLKARQDMEATMEKEYNAFVDLHPELESDPQLADEVFALVEEFGATSRKQGKIMSMKDALTKAWTFLGKDDAEEKVVIKAKEVAAKPKTGSTAKKTTKKSEFTEEQVRIAKKWGLTPEQLAAAKSS